MGPILISFRSELKYFVTFLASLDSLGKFGCLKVMGFTSKSQYLRKVISEQHHKMRNQIDEVKNLQVQSV